MKTFLFWLFLFALLWIHSVDMELTRYYIGNQWENETFPLMRMCIKEFGIYNAIWVSRVFCYIFFYIAYIYRERENLIFMMFLITILYYVSMISWLFNLGLVEWPLPQC